MISKILDKIIELQRYLLWVLVPAAIVAFSILVVGCVIQKITELMR